MDQFNCKIFINLISSKNNEIGNIWGISERIRIGNI